MLQNICLLYTSVLTTVYSAGRLTNKFENNMKKSLSDFVLLNNKKSNIKEYKRLFKVKNNLDSRLSEISLKDQQNIPAEKLSDEQPSTTEKPDASEDFLEDDVKKRKIDVDYIEGSEPCDDLVRLHCVEAVSYTHLDVYKRQM